MSLRQSTRTPCRALTLAEMGMASSRTKQKPIPSKNDDTVTSRPTSQAKRLVDLYEDMFPPTVRRQNTTSVKKMSKPANSIQKTYLSTSKKQVQTRKTDHTIVRRALNFIATNQIEEIQVHPKSKKITRHTIAPVRKNNEMSNITDRAKTTFLTPLNKENNERKGILHKPVPNDSTHDTRSTVTQSNHTYDLRNRPTVNNSSENFLAKNIHTFTQYRNVNDSFDVSIHEEPSPQINVAEKSVIEPLEKAQPNALDSHLSDLLCDMLCKTELTSNNSNITQKLEEIRDMVQENIENTRKQMECMSSLFDIVSKMQMTLSLSTERNTQILEMTNDLLKSINDDEAVKKPSKTNKLTSIPVSRRSIVKPIVYNIPQVSSANSVAKNIISPFENSEVKLLHPIAADASQNNALRGENKIKTLLRNVKNSAAKENLSPLQKKTYSPKKTADSPKSNQRKLKNNDLRTTVLKCKFESNKNFTNRGEESPSKQSKSQLMFKSLKNSVKFLKTPVGKEKTNVSSNVAFETPNTRSRNITSNNIKRQLESLYDS